MTRRTRSTLHGLAAGLVAALLLLALRATYVLQAVELKTLDMRFRTFSSMADADTSIVIVDVDNHSLDLTRETLGRFPWPRDTWAMVTDYLTAAGARVIAYDLLFADHDLRNPAADSAFAESSRNGRVVQAMMLQHVGRADDDVFETAQLPYAELLDAAHTIGVINFAPHPVDGAARATPLHYRYQDREYPALGLAIAASAGEVNEAAIPLSDGALLINWHGPYRDAHERRETYRVIPVAQLFNSYRQVAAGEAPEIPLESLRDKIVLIGSSGAGLFDARENPFGAADPGVLIHATVADNILNRDFLRRAPLAVNIALLLFTALLAGALVALVATAWRSALLALALIATYLGITAWAFAAQHVWIDAAAPALGMLFAFTGAMTLNYVTEGRQKRQIRDMFSKYVAPEYVAQLAEDPERLHLEGTRARLAVLFSDIRGFTSISEQLEPPQVIAFLNEYLDEMAELVKESGGTLDKFIGDAVMAFWGEPIRHEDYTRRACECALAMRDATARLADRFEKEGKPRIAIGIGINTGDVVVGNIGSLAHKLDYTVIGDTVNLASRLEGLNKEFGTTIIISEFALADVSTRYRTRPLGSVNVKGKAKAVEIFELLDRLP